MIAHPHVDLVIAKTGEYLHVAPEAILGPSRYQEVVEARHVAIFLARELTGLSYMRLGEFFNRDHTVILAALRKIAEQLTRDGRLAAMLDLLRDRIGDDLAAAAGEGQVLLA